MRICEVEIRETEHGPEIVLFSLTGEEIDALTIAKWYDRDDDIEEALDHQCETCEQSHCDDGHCCSIDKVALENAIQEVKHTFHEMEKIVDRG